MSEKKVFSTLLALLLIVSGPLPGRAAPSGFTGQILEIHPEDSGNYRLVVKHRGGTSEFTISPQTLIRASLGASQVETGDQILLDQNAALAEISDGFIDAYGRGEQKSTTAPLPPKAPELPARPDQAAAGGDHERPPAPPKIPPPPKGPPDTRLPNEPEAPPPEGGLPPDAQAANENLQQQAMDMMQQGGAGPEAGGSQQDGGQQDGGDQKQSSSEKKPKPWEKELKDPREHKDTLDLDEPALSVPGDGTAAQEPGATAEGLPESEVEGESAAPAPQGPFGNRVQVIAINRTEETVTMELQDIDQKKTSASFAADQSVMIVLRPEDLTLDMLVQLEVASDEEGALRTVTVLTVTAEKGSAEDLQMPAVEQAPRSLPGPEAQIDEDLWLDLQNMSGAAGTSQDAQ